MKNIFNTPPNWCPDAIPSDRGWRHPVTKELLVSVRGGVKLAPKEVLELPVEEPVIDEAPSAVVVLDNEPEAPKEVLDQEDKPVVDATVSEAPKEPEDKPVVDATVTEAPKARRGRKKNVE